MYLLTLIFRCFARLLFRIFFLNRLNLGHAAVMTLAAHIFAGEERGDDFLHHARTEAFFPKRKHVGVVVITGIFGAIGIMAMRAPHSGYFVGDDRNAYSR